MGVIEDKLLEAIEIIAESKDNAIPYDYTVRGRVVEINSNICTVNINGEEYSAYIMNGINIGVNDIVLIKKINNNDSDKVVVGKLGTVGSGGGGGVSLDWNDVINAPTTISGYGITDAYTKTEVDNKLEEIEVDACWDIEGGNASTIYTVSQNINGGGANG